LGSSIYGFFTIVFILLCLWFLAFIMTKFIGNKSKSAMKSKYMRVVDTMAMGFDKTLYLVKVGEQYIIMCSSQKGFDYICSLNNDFSIRETNVESEEANTTKGFSKYFDFFKPVSEEKTKQEDNDIENNIERLKKLFNKKD